MSDILLVNQWHPLPESFQPDELVDLWKMQPRHFFLTPWPQYLTPAAAEAANSLFEAAEHDGLVDFVVRSTYRTRATQAKLYEKHPKNGQTAVPGASEHETGLAMDIGTVAGGIAEGDRHANWLSDHCWDHGFILRYQPHKVSVTGIPSEPWHFRYVGVGPAREMRDLDLALEEYLARGEA